MILPNLLKQKIVYLCIGYFQNSTTTLKKKPIPIVSLTRTDTHRHTHTRESAHTTTVRPSYCCQCCCCRWCPFNTNTNKTCVILTPMFQAETTKTKTKTERNKIQRRLAIVLSVAMLTCVHIWDLPKSETICIQGRATDRQTCFVSMAPKVCFVKSSNCYYSHKDTMKLY